MCEFLDGLDAADEPVPRDERVAAALGPKMLDLAGEGVVGLDCTTPVEHTRSARERPLGRDPARTGGHGRGRARRRAGPRARTRVRRPLLERSNYKRNLLRLGFEERDFEGGGSARLIDAVIPHGSAEQVAEAAQAWSRSANHVACSWAPLHGPALLDDYRALAKVLL